MSRENVESVPENVETVRRIYDAWNRDEVDAALAVIDPAFELQLSGSFPGFDPVYRGHGGVREFWHTMKEAWEHLTVEVERVLEEGNTVVAVLSLEGMGRASGVNVGWLFTHVWEVEAGVALRQASYPSLEEALQATGLRE